MNAKILAFRRAGGDPMDDPRAKNFRYEKFKWSKMVLASDLTATEKNVLLAIDSRMDSDDGTCFPSVETIAEDSNLSTRTVQRSVKSAQEKGWLSVSRKRGHRSKYEATIPSVTPDNLVTRDKQKTPATRDAVVTPDKPVTRDSAVAKGVTGLSRRGDTVVTQIDQEYIKEQIIPATPAAREAPDENSGWTSDTPNPADVDLERFIHQELDDQGLKPRIGESGQIARRLALSGLSDADRRKYLVDDIASLRLKVDEGTDRRWALSWLGTAKSIAHWRAALNAASQQPAAPTTSSGSQRGAKRHIPGNVEGNFMDQVAEIEAHNARVAAQKAEGGQP